MSRVQIDSQSWGVVQDTAGNAVVGATVDLKIAGTATDATHYSAVTAGTSSAADLLTDANGLVKFAGIRFIEEGSYDMTVSGVTRRVEAVSGTSSSYQAIATDADFTLQPSSLSPQTTRHTGVLTAARSANLSVTGAVTGSTYTISRSGTGAFNLNVLNGIAGSTIKALTTGTWGDFKFDGTNWFLLRFGSL